MIDIYLTDEKNKEYIDSINETEYSFLLKLFICYKNKTGYFIDEYGILQLKHNQLNPFIETIKSFLKENSHEIYEKIYNLAMKAKQENKDLLFVGD
jgi:hypothetical protein